jgi:two-component system response regulator HydG
MLLQFLKSVKQATKKAENNFVQGISKASKLVEYIQLVSPTNMSVLIIGESGTGKEVIAKVFMKTVPEKY